MSNHQSPCTPSDELPRSLRGLISLSRGNSAEDLLALGGQTPNSPRGAGGPVAAGLEKRLELDIEGAFDYVGAQASLCRVLAEAGECAFQRAEVDKEVLFLIFDRAIVIATAAKIVLSADSAVPTHKCVAGLCQLVAAAACRVEWMSFVRKNTTAPWAANADTLLALEYGELKSAFPEGHSFLFGPIDSAHHFYFVYDGVDRASGNKAMELQMNVVLHGIRMQPDAMRKYGLEESSANNASPSKTGAADPRLHLMRCNAVAPGQYEVMRVLDDESRQRHSCGAIDEMEAVAWEGQGFACVLETNAVSNAYCQHINDLVTDFTPERFSVTYLLDPACPDADTFDPSVFHFADYKRDVQIFNEFSGGYMINKAIFVRVA